ESTAVADNGATHSAGYEQLWPERWIFLAAKNSFQRLWTEQDRLSWEFPHRLRSCLLQHLFERGDLCPCREFRLSELGGARNSSSRSTRQRKLHRPGYSQCDTVSDSKRWKSRSDQPDNRRSKFPQSLLGTVAFRNAAAVEQSLGGRITLRREPFSCILPVGKC